jgi:cytochrome c biogenesis factor
MDVSGRTNGALRTGINNYTNGDTSREVGIHTNWLRAEDLYVIFDQRDGNAVFFKVLVKPLVNLLWVAGVVFLFGSLVAMWPDAREQRRLVARLSLART